MLCTQARLNTAPLTRLSRSVVEALFGKKQK
jgi:hypothetical protein